ncbi:hypothetical protein HYC85_022623 [Camellia sinensis]|uniref:Uncharacterized protein n=1 Tax=Camellia sinensis TaxID=4442 RepID=A0A7J7GG37_CAMSI|nr:hypothetical protein HYC85_022623 [Camellia sinensis]
MLILDNRVYYMIEIFLCAVWAMGKANTCHPILDNLNIDQHRTDRIIQGKPEWNVTVINNCNCSRQGMALSCAGFKTAEPIDPAIFKPIDNGLCAVLPNKLLKPHDTVKDLVSGIAGLDTCVCGKDKILTSASAAEEISAFSLVEKNTSKIFMLNPETKSPDAEMRCLSWRDKEKQATASSDKVLDELYTLNSSDNRNRTRDEPLAYVTHRRRRFHNIDSFEGFIF